MGIQQKLDKALTPAKRKLFDNTINVLGLEVDGVRIRVEEDMYSNEDEPTILRTDTISCIINYPPELPLFRSRSDNNELPPDKVVDNGSSTGVFFFEILPIEIWTKWSDNVESGDFIIHKIEDEQGNDLKIILKVSEVLGSFRSSLIWKKLHCALYNGKYESMLSNIIDNV